MWEFAERGGVRPRAELIGATVAAQMLGSAGRGVQQLHHKGALRGQQVGRSLVFARSTVEERAKS